MRDTPNTPGWYAFEGKEWEQIRVFCTKEESDGIYDDDDWDEGDEPLVRYFRYEERLGEPFQDVVEVRYTRDGETVIERRRSGPYRGEPMLGYVLSQHWNRYPHSIDQRVGHWTRLYMPWDQDERGER